MSFEEEFDKIIKQKADDADFPFDEKNWEKVSQQLDAERNGRGILAGRRLYIVATMFILFSVLGVYLLKDTDTDISLPESTNLAVTNNQTIPEKQIQTAEKIPAKEESQATTYDDKKIISPESSLKSASTLNLMKREKVGNFASNATIRKRPADSENSAGNTNIASKGINDDKANISTPAPGSPIPDVTPLTQALAPAEVPLVESSENDKPIIEEAKEIPEIFQVAQMFAIPTSLASDPDDRDILPTQFSAMKYHDDDYFKNKKNKTHFLNVEAGTTYLTGWKAANGNDGKDFNWFAGINYGLYLSRKMTVGAGVQFYNISNITQPFYSGSTTEYGFSSVTSHTLITASSLYYFSIPVKFSYAINSQNQFGVGFNMGFLANANNNVETYTSSPETGNTPAANAKKTGAYNGIAPTVMLLSAFYKTKLTKRLALNGEFIYGLTDLFQNTTTNKNIENAIGFRLSLQYTLFDK